MNINKQIILKNIIFGCIMGFITVVLDNTPYSGHDTFLFLGFASGCFGIWGICSLLIILRGAEPKQTGLNLFAFLGSMSVVYYLCEGIRDSAQSYVTLQNMDIATKEMMGLGGGLAWLNFGWDRCLFWLLISLACAVYAHFVAKVKSKLIYIALCSLPLLVILLEGIHYSYKAIEFHTGLAPALVDILGFLIISFLLIKRVKATPQA